MATGSAEAARLLSVATVTGSCQSIDHPDVLEHRAVVTLDSDHGTVLQCSMTATVSDGVVVQGERLPTVRMRLDAGTWTAHWFVSDWGDEFTPRQQVVGPDLLRLDVRTGRSSKGMHPWLLLVRDDGHSVLVSPAWSGNWMIECRARDDGSVDLVAGISDWRFRRRIDVARPFVAPDVYLAHASDRRSVGAALAQAFGRAVLPQTSWTRSMPVAWNHWWPYEDAEIDAETFVANAAVAAESGLDVATLDAGWFGRPDASSFWEKVRGDWHLENTERFPGGLRPLAERVRDLGLAFGVWIEAEAVGTEAVINLVRPDVLARHDDPDDPYGPQRHPEDPGWLGYVCLGSPAGREHVRGSIEHLLERTGARWIKIDFNLDPAGGCTRIDHGHDSGDGLYEHYRGLYLLLDDLRDAHPDLLIEACSSGGLRIDLGLLSHLHCAFLSDPDWTEFHLQLMWGASQMLPAAAMFHFSESQWRTFHPLQNLDVTTVDMATFDSAMRAVALHRFAVSYRLAEWPLQLLERLREHLAVQEQVTAPLIANDAIIVPLTPQPRREGGGHRFPSFQLTDGRRHVITALHLDGADETTTIHPVHLRPEQQYQLRMVGPGADASDLPDLPGALEGVVFSGADLMGGISLARRGDARSWMIALDPTGPYQETR